MIMKKVLFLVAIFLVQGVVAQKIIKNLEGTVVNSMEDVSGVHIINLTSKKATITDLNGHFTIPIRLKDTLIISAVQFKKEKIIVSEILMALQNFTIQLEAQLTELDEVLLDQRRTLVTAKSLGLPNADVMVLPLSERALIAARKWVTNNTLSIDPVFNFISGRTKMLTKRVARDKRYERSQKMRQMYSDSIFAGDLKIATLKIEEFMLFCEMDTRFDYVSIYANDIGRWDFLVRKSEEFRKNYKLKELDK